MPINFSIALAVVKQGFKSSVVYAAVSLNNLRNQKAIGDELDKVLLNPQQPVPRHRLCWLRQMEPAFWRGVTGDLYQDCVRGKWGCKSCYDELRYFILIQVFGWWKKEGKEKMAAECPTLRSLHSDCALNTLGSSSILYLILTLSQAWGHSVLLLPLRSSPRPNCASSLSQPRVCPFLSSLGTYPTCHL